MYFIQKAAIYSHGVFWIGENLEEAKKECDRLGLEDLDAHHTYTVYEFGILNSDEMPRKGDKGYYSDFEHDPEHKLMYRFKKTACFAFGHVE